MAAAVGRVIDVVRALALAPGGLLATDLASELRVSRQAATRLLGLLARSGVAHKHPATKRYSLTLMLYEWVGQDIQRRLPLSVVRKELGRLAARLQHRVDYVVLEGDSIFLIERSEWLDGVVVTAPRPWRGQWQSTATGKAIVAFSPPDVSSQLLRSRTSGLGAAQISSLRRELEEIRDRGYASAELRPGRLGLASPILDSSGFALGAIGIPLAEPEDDSELGRQFIEPLKEAALRCAEELGHPIPAEIA